MRVSEPTPDLDHQLAAIRATAASNGHALTPPYLEGGWWLQGCTLCTAYLFYNDGQIIGPLQRNKRCSAAEKEAGVG